MTLPTLTPAALGSRLRAKLVWLAEGYGPMMAAETVEEWLAWPLARWERLWAGMEQAQALDELGRRAMDLHGCPFGQARCPVNGPMVCAACAGLAEPVQGKLDG